MKKTKKTLTATDVAQKGGKATLKKHGKSHFSEMAKKRWNKVKKKK